MKKQIFNITGMSCAACQANITKNVNKINGIINTDVNLISNKMTVEFDETKTSEAEIINTVISIGYGAQLSDGSKTKLNSYQAEITQKNNSTLVKLIISLLLLLPLMYLSMGPMVGLNLPENIGITTNPLFSPFTQLLITMIIVILNKHFYISGIKALIKKSPNMDSLVSIGSEAALLYGVFTFYLMLNAQVSSNTELLHHYSHNLYFESAAMILTLVSLGKFLEKRSKAKTTDSISKLINLAPKTVNVIRNDVQVTILAQELIKGDIVIIKPGDILPADGIIIQGSGTLDQSAITGESIPVDKFPGDNVTSATTNKNGYFTFEATKVGEDSTLSQIIKLVEEAGNSKAPIARLADKISGIFVPFVLGISLVTAIIWLLTTKNFEFSLDCAISVLVISCPCALGLATPVAIMVGTGKAAESGILIKSAESLEVLGKINTVVLDKTGTLTTGIPKVTDIILYNDKYTEIEFINLVAALESGSNHPLAVAITKEAGDLTSHTIKNFINIPGNGIKGEILGQNWCGGNLKFIKTLIDSQQEISWAEESITSLSSQGKTPLIFAENNKIIGIIAVADTLREETTEVIRSLKAMNIEPVMLTGDNSRTAKHIADNAGILTVISDVLPQDKDSEIQKLQQSGKIVAMVGDGINDAPALLRSDIGIAIGAGTDIAIDSADIILIKSSLEDMLTSIKLSKKVMNNIKMNLFWAFFYNILGIPLAAGVLYPVLGLKLSPMIGALAMSLSSICVVANALRLRYFNNKKKGIKKMKKELKINGMACNHCKATVEKVLSGLEGVESCEVDLKKKTATLELSKDIDDSILMNTVKEAGFEPVSCK